ncbi:MAG: GNAT family N-acetyltransferase [Oscillospiraceae bacterium]|nr:GNAT family N-acetyltransferase [Oscillospiraceae bacterium]
MEYVQIANSDEKSKICERILKLLPEWFGVPESVESYIREVCDMPFLAAVNGGDAIAFLALKEHSEHTAEVHVMGIMPKYHRQGMGSTLVKEAENLCRKAGRSFLTVKTLDKSRQDESYLRTLAFYRAMGFLPLQVLEGYWDENNPCLMLAKWVT